MRHERHVGLRALQRAERRAVAERARVLAAVVEALQAEEAFAAGGLKAAEHAVADGHARDRVARRDDGADVLVADREARLDLHAPVVDVQVRAAHAGRVDAHDRVVAAISSGSGRSSTLTTPGAWKVTARIAREPTDLPWR